MAEQGANVTSIVPENQAGEGNALADHTYRELPHNIQIEQSVLGSLLTNNEALNRIGDFFQANFFYEPVHQRIFEAVQSFYDKGIIATPITLKNYFEKDEALQEVGGAEYLARLASLGGTIINLSDYAKILADLALRRSLIELGEDMVNTAYDTDIERDAQRQIESTEQSLFNLATEGNTEGGFVSIDVSLNEAMERVDAAFKKQEEISGIPTKFEDLDKILGGLQDSDLLILAGRPSMGKTAVSINLAVNACQKMVEYHDESSGGHKPSVGFFSLEMSAEQLAARMIAMESGVNSAKMRVGNLNNSEFEQLVRANQALHQLPFFIDDTPALSISALRTRARRLKRRHNLSLLVIDYLQLLRGSSKASADNRVQEVSEITQGLKAIAKELNIPVIALSQLSRAVEQREDKRPQLSDLRESGSIEQDADIVLFIYREEYYVSRKEPPQQGTEKYASWQEEMNRCMNITELIVAKHRNGPIGSAKLFFNSNTTKFENLAQQRDF